MNLSPNMRKSDSTDELKVDGAYLLYKEWVFDAFVALCHAQLHFTQQSMYPTSLFS